MSQKGFIALHRKLLDSRVFNNEGLLKVWIWCLLRANHKETWVNLKVGKGTTEVHLLPGQFIFGRDSAARELHMNPSTVWKRMQKLKNMQNCDIQSNSHYSIVSVINWEGYQYDIKKRNSQGDSRVTAKEQPGDTDNNVNNVNKKTTPDFSSLRKRYSQTLIDQVFEAIASTRKSGKVKDSILIAQLQKWKKYPTEQVERGIKVYLEKDYASRGKREAYLFGIIRGNSFPKRGRHDEPERIYTELN